MQQANRKLPDALTHVPCPTLGVLAELREGTSPTPSVLQHPVYIEKENPGYRDSTNLSVPTMDPSQPAVSNTLSEAKYIDFPCLPPDAKHEDGTPALNRYSATMTRGHDFPGAQVCLIYRRSRVFLFGTLMI